ncbi:MAG: endonuclease/exonuclease/phosphatase family protein, partial [Deltaproteobacteria bacterium]|nr:endonuclease/exonuclease/phosphatase family protein [Deltaproteobacteria bacterium]
RPMGLSVLTLNLWHDSGPYESRVERIRGWIDRLDPDLIGFQEVLRADAGNDQVVELLGDRPYQIDYVEGSRYQREGSKFSPGGFGNAIASRWPILDRETLALPDAAAAGRAPDAETRAAISVTIDAPFGEIGFTCTHLHWRLRDSVVREKQVVALGDLALRRRPATGFPPILVGDFNAEPESAEIRYVSGLQSLEGRSVALLDAWKTAGDGGPGYTWDNTNPYADPELEPNRRIDYIFAGFPMRTGVGQLTSCRLVCNDEEGGVWPADHFGVYAEFRTDPIPGFEDLWGLVGGDDVNAER